MSVQVRSMRSLFDRSLTVGGCVLTVVALGLVVIASSTASAEADPKKAKGKKAAPAQTAPAPKASVSNDPVDKLLRTGDGWTIATTYYPSVRGQEAPVVILLHGRQDDRLVWDQGFAKRLQNEGYAAIAVDLRKQGKSQSTEGEAKGGKVVKADFLHMVDEDMKVVKDFLMAEHQNHHLNIRKTAIIASEMSVPIAMAFAVDDWTKQPFDDAAVAEERTPRGQDVRALVMISPELSLPGLPTSSFIADVRNPDWGIAFLTIYASKDKLDKGDGKKLYQKLTISSEKKQGRSQLKTYPVSLRGTKMLDAETDMQDTMMQFLKDNLKNLDDPWRDRKSPLQQ